jgi:hypothetical protein
MHVALLIVGIVFVINAGTDGGLALIVVAGAAYIVVIADVLIAVFAFLFWWVLRRIWRTGPPSAVRVVAITLGVMLVAGVLYSALYR